MDVPRSERPATVQATIREELGIRLFTPPAEGFDPIEASARELHLHGYPRRPDPKLPPKVHEQWEAMVSRSNSIIEPEFAVLKDKGHKPVRYGPAGPPRLSAGNGWAGSTHYPKMGDAVMMVNGQWTVPRIVAPVLGLAYTCATWVGIDDGEEGLNHSPYIVQAGTTQRAFRQDITVPELGVQHFEFYDSFAWFEWFSADPYIVQNFKVSPGDSVACMIWVESLSPR
jgi:hypothetical protein